MIGSNEKNKTRTVEQLFAGLCAGETRALARAVSLVEDRAEGCHELLKLCRVAVDGRTRAFRLGITGPAGAGKSTLVDALTRELRARGRRVGIVAVDPSSAFSGGAILGDRIRLAGGMDAGVFMRSMATRGHLGGLAATTDDVLTVMEAAGFDWLLLETTGVGQGEVEVAGLADAVAVVLVPGMGDAVQSLKAGVLEIASVFVLNKADRDGPDGIARLEAEIEEMVGLSAVISGRMGGPRIVKTVATTGVGVVELLGVVEGLAAGGRAGVKTPSGFSPRLPGLKPRPTAEATVLPAGAVLDHLGIAVRSIADSRRLYEALGVRPGEVEEIPQERVRALMLTLGESRIELLEAAESDSVIARFVAKRGEGLHHVALRVADLARTVERLKALGVRLVSETIQVGAGGHKYVFVHPASANGVLLELVEADGGHAE